MFPQVRSNSVVTILTMGYRFSIRITFFHFWFYCHASFSTSLSQKTSRELIHVSLLMIRLFSRRQLGPGHAYQAHQSYCTHLIQIAPYPKVVHLVRGHLNKRFQGCSCVPNFLSNAVTLLTAPRYCFQNQIPPPVSCCWVFGGNTPAVRATLQSAIPSHRWKMLKRRQRPLT